jgi:hypothetical protein
MGYKKGAIVTVPPLPPSLPHRASATSPPLSTLQPQTREAACVNMDTSPTTTTSAHPYPPSTNSIGGGGGAAPWLPDPKLDFQGGMPTTRSDADMMGHFANPFAAAILPGEGNHSILGDPPFTLEPPWMNALSLNHASVNTTVSEEERSLNPNYLQLQPGVRWLVMMEVCRNVSPRVIYLFPSFLPAPVPVLSTSFSTIVVLVSHYSFYSASPCIYITHLVWSRAYNARSIDA